MARYRMTVVRIDPNPAFDPERANAAAAAARANEFRNWHDPAASYSVPATVEAGTLSVELDEADWDRVRCAVVEGWK